MYIASSDSVYNVRFLDTHQTEAKELLSEKKILVVSLKWFSSPESRTSRGSKSFQLLLVVYPDR